MSDEVAPEDQFELFARLLLGYVDASAGLRGRAQGPTSRVTREIEEHPELPMRQAWVHPRMILTVADDHLRALAAAIEAPEVALSIMTTSRLATELGSLAYWLLEPTLTPKQRAARFLAHRLDDATRQARAVARNSEVFGKDLVRAANDELDEVRRDIDDAGFAIERVRGATLVGGETLVEATERAGIALGDSAPLGAILYDQSSGILHGRETAVRSYFIPTEETPSEPGVSFARLRIDSDRVALAVSAAVFPHHQALRFLINARGQLEDRAWEQSFQRLYLQGLRPHLTTEPIYGASWPR